jgi:hypothetical protein
MGFFLQIKYRDRPDRWMTVGVHATLPQAARHGGRALAGSVAPSGADAVAVRVITEGQLRQEVPVPSARAYRVLAVRARAGSAELPAV